jgi:L-ascorbate metabolism protein UlaG (beta-lactamase superfamily)
MARTDSLTWIGHSTVLLDVAGVRIVTDPALTSTLAHLRRRRPAPSLDGADVVAVSHVHMDHLHRPSIRKVVTDRTRIVVPVGAQALLRGLGTGPIDEVGVGDRVTIGDVPHRVTIEAVPAAHRNRRGPHSRVAATPLGYVVRWHGGSVYFAGDTGLFDEMVDIGPVDVALLPIWGWGPTIGEWHLDPARAAEATERLRARHVVPIHWGTYSPVRPRRGSPPWLDRPLDVFRVELASRSLADRLVELLPGESTALAWPG